MTRFFDSAALQTCQVVIQQPRFRFSVHVRETHGRSPLKGRILSGVPQDGLPPLHSIVGPVRASQTSTGGRVAGLILDSANADLCQDVTNDCPVDIR